MRDCHDPACVAPCDVVPCVGSWLVACVVGVDAMVTVAVTVTVRSIVTVIVGGTMSGEASSVPNNRVTPMPTNKVMAAGTTMRAYNVLVFRVLYLI